MLPLRSVALVPLATGLGNDVTPNNVGEPLDTLLPAVANSRQTALGHELRGGNMESVVGEERLTSNLSSLHLVADKSLTLT